MFVTGASGSAANVVVMIPVGDVGVPDQDDPHAFAFEDQVEVGERRAAVRDQDRRSR